MSDPLITPAAAAKAAGISKTSIRNYLGNPCYAESFSPDARHTPRLFTHDDVRLLRFIAQETRQGHTHEQIAAALAAGELAADEWQPPLSDNPQPTKEGEPHAQPAQDQQTVALMLVGRELEASRARADALWERVVTAEARAAAAEAKATQLEGQLADARRPWWRRLAGR